MLMCTASLIPAPRVSAHAGYAGLHFPPYRSAANSKRRSGHFSAIGSLLAVQSTKMSEGSATSAHLALRSFTSELLHVGKRGERILHKLLATRGARFQLTS